MTFPTALFALTADEPPGVGQGVEINKGEVVLLVVGASVFDGQVRTS